MDKNVLIQYVEMKEEIKDLRRRIHENERELAKLENMIVTDSVTRGKRGKKPLGTVKITGRPTAAIALKQKLLKKRNDRLTALEAELLEITNQAEEYIETIGVGGGRDRDYAGVEACGRPDLPHARADTGRKNQ